MAEGKQWSHCESSSNVGREEEWQGGGRGRKWESGSGIGRGACCNLVLSGKGRGSSTLDSKGGGRGRESEYSAGRGGAFSTPPVQEKLSSYMTFYVDR